ncbi:MAG: hypothetical protein ACK5NT_01445 [Pyrinomonadaceae bacterium]
MTVSDQTEVCRTNGGNIVADAQGRSFFYDAENKQKEVRNSSNAIIGQYFFDGEQRRAAPIKQTRKEGYGIRNSSVRFGRTSVC